MKTLNLPLSNMQLELLSLFSRDLEDNEIREIKRLIVNYLAQKLAFNADKVWEEKGWTNEDMNKFLNTHMRTPYQTKKN